MGYIVFARKYRPQVFDEIVGQSHVTTTLKNAISQNRVAHAYLFAGPRGVGKTTAARIFAKALNCEKGPAANPCNACASCLEISQGSSLDVLEIDGASNRGIDEIRNLRESVKFSPSKSRSKVYIIDEVHMLTPEAFNALLKTLEEPPSHVKFIFATTQAHKVPPTILSRCQRFDFRRISAGDILDNLKLIKKNETLSLDDEVLALVVRHSDGSMRDAQVVLDQIISFSRDRKVTLADAAQVLGMVEDEVLFGLSGSIAKKDAVAALRMIERLVLEGKDLTQVVMSLIEHFRNLCVAKIGKDAETLIETGPDRIKDYKDAASCFTIAEMLYVIYTLSNTIDFIRKSNIPRIPFEAAMIKLTQVGSAASLDEIMKRLDGLGGLEKVTSKEVTGNRLQVTGKEDTAGPKPEAKDKISDAPAKPSEGSADLEEVLSSWQGIINYIKNKKISIASYLQEGYPIEAGPNTISIGFPKEFQLHKEMLELPENRKLIEEAISSVLKLSRRVVLAFVEQPEAKKPPRYPGKEAAGEEMSAEEGSVREEADPIVKAALEMFNGEISDRASRKPGPK